MKIFRVTVTDKRAVYINHTRITSRSTKWGVHNTIDEFRCAAKNVRRRLQERGHASLRLDEGYCAEFGI